MRDDLKKTVGLRGAARLIRQDPRLLLRFALYLVVAYGLLVLGLVLAGQLAAFDDWAVYPALVAAGLFGADRYARR